MQREQWKQQTSDDEARRRAAGRRSYNARRQFKAAARRTMLAMLLRDAGPLERGRLAELAHDLGVHRATLWRDMREIARQERAVPGGRAALFALFPGIDD